MFSLHYSKEKNRIYISIKGTLSASEFEAYKNQIMELIDSAVPGFTVLADLSHSDKLVIEKSDNFNVIREYGAEKGFHANALVLDEEGFKRFTGNDESKGKNVFLSKEHADHYLDQII